MKGLKFLLVIPLLFIASGADAFDVWGLHTGMTQKEVIAAARQQGYAMHQELPGVWPLQAVSFMQEAGNGQIRIGYEAGFCKDKLEWVSRNYQGNMSNLVALLAKLTKKYGVPQAVGKAPAGKLDPYLLTFVFPPQAKDGVKILVSPVGPSVTAYSIQVTYGGDVYCGLVRGSP